MSRQRKDLRGALGHGLVGLCVNPSLAETKRIVRLNTKMQARKGPRFYI